VSFAALYVRASAAAARLEALGIGPGDGIGVLGPNDSTWAAWAFGVWMRGCTLVPIPFNVRVRDREALSEQVATLSRVAGCAVVLAHPDLVHAAPDEAAASWELDGDGLARRMKRAPQVRPDQPATIQFTSGSTGSPKAAVVTHAAILASIRQAALAFDVDASRDRFLGWLPFFHDNGLVGYLARPVVLGCEGDVMSTAWFAAEPAAWLRLMREAGTTITTAPSSAWAAALRAAERDRGGIDLSMMRLAILSAETIDPDVVDRLVEAAPGMGLRPNALAGAYGLAEATLTVTVTTPGAGLGIESVDADRLGSGVAAPARSGAVKRVASCGRALPGLDVRILGEGGPLDDRRVGEICVRGPTLMRGYLGDGNRAVQDGWLRTGDLGYLAQGELFVTGRAEDVIIVTGRNHAPEDLEWAAGRVPGLRPGRCVAFQRPGGAEGEAVLLVEARDGSAGSDLARDLAREVRRSVADAVGVFSLEVVIVEQGTVPKTTSGKLRRSAAKEAFASGSLEPRVVSRSSGA